MLLHEPLAAVQMPKFSFRTGASGGVPTNATAVVLAVIEVDATTPTFITVWPAGWVTMFNLAGAVHLVADLGAYH